MLKRRAKAPSCPVLCSQMDTSYLNTWSYLWLCHNCLELVLKAFHEILPAIFHMILMDTTPAKKKKKKMRSESPKIEQVLE